MNKIYKVMYSKVRQCYVVVSEIAKSHGRHTKSSVAKSSAVLTATVLIALGAVSFVSTPVAQADTYRNNFAGTNDEYYEQDKKGIWTQEQYNLGLLSVQKQFENFNGKGARGVGSIAIGLQAQASQETITIGNRNASSALGSVYVGQNNRVASVDQGRWVTSVGFNSDATGYGTVALGSNAVAKNDKPQKNIILYQENNHHALVDKPEIEGASMALGYGAESNY